MMQRILVFTIIASFILIGCTSRVVNVNVNSNQPASSNIGLANPASEYCIQQGGKIEIVADEEGGQYGVCKFEDSSQCEEWAYFNGKCRPGDSLGVE